MRIIVTINSLIVNGYLPYEVVPALSTKKLGAGLSTILPQIQNFDQRDSKYCVYSLPKVKNFRRVLAIPNPLHQIKLCKIIVDNWNSIDGFLKLSEISKSTPHVVNPFIHRNEERAFFREIRIADIPKTRALHSNNARYMLKADISRFFPTIYTHTIPWAIHTKATAKASLSSRQLLRSLFGNLVDEGIRNTQDKQTLGIPIGPDTSLLVSEIICTAIDIDLVKRLKQAKITFKGFRFVDDFYFHFPKLSDAEFALSTLYSILRHYELDLNTEKTKIIELPDILDSKWILELNEFPLESTNGKSQADNLITYFSRAFELSKKFTGETVLKYAINEIADVMVEKDHWELYESLLLKSMIAEPAVLPTVTEILLAYKNLKYPLNKKRIAETINELINYHSKYTHSHELAWSLWIAKTLKIRLTKGVALEISKVEDSVVALVALDLFQLGLIKKLDTTKWKSLMTADELYSSHWLLAYEALVKGWLQPANGTDYIRNDPFFNLLRNSGVEFYSSANQVTPAMITIAEKSQRKRERRRQRKGY